MKPTKHIAIEPRVCGGKPCIAGSRIRVWDIYVCHELKGKIPAEIVVAFPSLTLADVHAALAYYWDNKMEIDQQMKRAGDLVRQLRRQTGPGPLEAKLRGMDAEGSDSISS